MFLGQPRAAARCCRAAGPGGGPAMDGGALGGRGAASAASGRLLRAVEGRLQGQGELDAGPGLPPLWAATAAGPAASRGGCSLRHARRLFFPLAVVSKGEVCAKSGELLGSACGASLVRGSVVFLSTDFAPPAPLQSPGGWAPGPLPAAAVAWEENRAVGRGRVSGPPTIRTHFWQ